MASQQFIANQETEITDAIMSVQKTTSAWKFEYDWNPGHLHPENRNNWGTLYINAKKLKNELEQLISHMDKEFFQPPGCKPRRTFAQWSKETGILPTTKTIEHNAISVVIDITDPNRPELWELADYIVSSASGAVVWLVPRKSDDE
jgi:hypothetical protein